MAAVVQNPGEDTPRLEYADWLDENATCERDAERAEFIRVQVDAAARPVCPKCRNTGVDFATGSSEPVTFIRNGHGVSARTLDVTPVACDCGMSVLLNRSAELLTAEHPCARRPWMPEYKASNSLVWKGETRGESMGLVSLGPEALDFSRGFVGRVSVRIETFMMRAGEIADTLPLESVRLHGISPVLIGEQGWNNNNGSETIAPYIGFGWIEYEPTRPGAFVNEFSVNHPDVIPEDLWDLVDELRSEPCAKVETDAASWLSWACVVYAAKRSQFPRRKIWCPRPERALWHPKSLGIAQYDLLMSVSGGFRPPEMARVKGDYAYRTEVRARSRRT